MFLLVDNYDSFTYNLKALFENQGAEIRVIKNDQYADADDFEGIILSPGPSTPENSGTTLKYLENYTGKKPFFGVCLGMQSICYSQGYNVEKAKCIMHGKKDDILSSGNNEIMKGLSEPFTAVRYHSLVASNLPDELVIARAKSDNEVMGYENNKLKLYGVQFHPESYLSDMGAQIVNNFIRICRG